MKRNLDITKPPYSEQKLILPQVPCPFVISRLHCTDGGTCLYSPYVVVPSWGVGGSLTWEKGKECSSKLVTSSETQGQIVGGKRKSKLMGKYFTKKSKERREEPLGWGQCLTRPVPNSRCRYGFWLVPGNFCVFLPNQKPEQRQLFGTGLVRHCPQGLFSLFFTFLRAIFFCPFRLSLAPTICPWVSEDELVITGTKSRKLIFDSSIFCLVEK